MLNSNNISNTVINVDQHLENISLESTGVGKAEGNNDKIEENKTENMRNLDILSDCNFQSKTNVDQNLEKLRLESVEVGEAEGNNEKGGKDKNENSNINHHLEKILLNSNSVLDCGTHSN